MKMKNSKGFAVLESLLILILVGIIAGTGWYVTHARKEADNNLKNAGTYTPYVYNAPKDSPKTIATSKNSATVAPKDCKGTLFYVAQTSGLSQKYEGTVALGSEKMKVSLKYPSGWTVSLTQDSLKVTDNKAAVDIVFHGFGFENPEIKSKQIDFSVDNIPLIDQTTTLNGKVLLHDLGFKDSEAKYNEISKKQFPCLTIVPAVNYPESEGTYYRDILARIFLSFVEES
jgi:hypothetical protein